MSNHNICSCGEVRKNQYLIFIEKKVLIRCYKYLSDTSLPVLSGDLQLPIVLFK